VKTRNLVPLGDFIEQIRGVSYKPSEIRTKSEEDYLPILRASNFDEEGLNTKGLIYIHKSRINENQLIKAGDILIASSSGSKEVVGKSIQFKEDFHGSFGAFCKLIRVKQGFATGYVGHFFKSKVYKNAIRKSVQGANINNLRNEHIDSLQIPRPSIADQIRIDNILSRAELLIHQRKESLRLLDEFLKSTFLEMFGDPVRNEKGFPRGTIRDLVDEVRYGTSKPASATGKYPYLRMNNITSNGYWDFSSLKFVDLDDLEKEKYIVNKGDLLFNRTNSKELVGKTAVFTDDRQMVAAGYLIRVRTIPNKANPWYIWGHLNSDYGKKTLFGICRNIVGMANINATELKNIKILIPPIDLQNNFAQIVERTEAIKTKYQESVQELESLYGSLSQTLFGKL
jgi:type I restriction enzyme S subunit